MDNHSFKAWRLVRDATLFTAGLSFGIIVTLSRQAWPRRFQPNSADEEKNNHRKANDTAEVPSGGCSAHEKTVNRMGQPVSVNPVMSRSDLEECISCPVCLEIVSTPLELGCGHTVCVHCTDEIMKQSAERMSVGNAVPKCPICRKRILGHICDLSINYAVSNLVDRVMAGDGKLCEHEEAKTRAAALLSERRKNGYRASKTDPSTAVFRGPPPTTSGGRHGFAVVL